MFNSSSVWYCLLQLDQTWPVSSHCTKIHYKKTWHLEIVLKKHCTWPWICVAISWGNLITQRVIWDPHFSSWKYFPAFLFFWWQWWWSNAHNADRSCLTPNSCASWLEFFFFFFFVYLTHMRTCSDPPAANTDLLYLYSFWLGGGHGTLPWRRLQTSKAIWPKGIGKLWKKNNRGHREKVTGESV